ANETSPSKFSAFGTTRASADFTVPACDSQAIDAAALKDVRPAKLSYFAGARASVSTEPGHPTTGCIKGLGDVLSTKCGAENFRTLIGEKCFSLPELLSLLNREHICCPIKGIAGHELLF